MRICFISWHGCIRVWKQGTALINAGHHIHFVQNMMSNAMFRNLLSHLAFYDAAPELAQHLKVIYQRDGLDLIVVHNEPNWMVKVAKDTLPDVPIILEAHDLHSTRYGKPDQDEQIGIDNADAYILPCIGYERHVESIYAGIMHDRPHKVFYSYCNKFFTSPTDVPRTNGIVYEGGVGMTSEEDRKNNIINFRDWTGVAKKLAKQGIRFHIYGGNDGYADHYMKLGASCYPMLQYMPLLQFMTAYDWGLAGFPVNQPGLNWSMPNKLFEYIAAGIPVIVFNCDEQAEFVRKHQLGVAIEDVDEIPAIYHLHEKYRMHVRQKRSEFVMENQVPDMVEFYNHVINLRRNKMLRRDYVSDTPGE